MPKDPGLATSALPAHTIGDVTATILTSKDMHAIREANITYYIWGIPFTIRTTIQTSS